MFEIKRYTADSAEQWNSFVAKSKQGTFLFNRNYMDYHSDRFTDSSFMFYHKGCLRAVLPANRVGDTLYSHQGLTYGGMLTDSKITVTDVCEIFKGINKLLQSSGCCKVVYKAMPWIYHRIPAEEDLYALTNICHAELVARDISSTIIQRQRIRFVESRKSGIRKAIRNGLTVSESTDLAAFWLILETNLGNRYNVKPVHSLSEMQLLCSRFPLNIRLYIASRDGEALGGTLIYVTPQVVHTQYISASPEGKSLGALDMLFDYIINKEYSDCEYFDFGKSTEDSGHYLNESLIFQKEGFGGRGMCYDTYAWIL